MNPTENFFSYVVNKVNVRHMTLNDRGRMEVILVEGYCTEQEPIVYCTTLKQNRLSSIISINSFMP